MFDITSFILGLQKGKSMGGGATETDILPLQDATFTQNPDNGLHQWFIAPAPAPIVIGETYRVKWGDDEFICTAFDGSAAFAGGVGLGNTMLMGGADTGEPFLFAYIPAAGEGVEYDTLGCLTLETDETHSVRIYQSSSDSNGTQKKLLLTSGSFTPEDPSTAVTVAHGHGRVPDIVYVASSIAPQTQVILSLSKGAYMGGIYFSKALMEAANTGKKDEDTQDITNGYGLIFGTTNSFVGGIGGAIDEDHFANSMWGTVRNCNQNTFIVGGSSAGMEFYRSAKYDENDNIIGYEPTEYRWWALSGLT